MPLGIIVTLFENDYAIGLAALINSLHAAGFRGTIVAGYRGGLPDWHKVPEDVSGCRIIFRPLDTSLHLTNYKPQFMRQVAAEFDPSRSGRVFYFDPDIVVLAPWPFFEEWADAGVALCEDVNSPMPDSHPIRTAWRGHMGAKWSQGRRSDLYVNGGFIGLSAPNYRFLEDWEDIQASIEPLSGSHVKRGPVDGNSCTRPHPFVYMDQDALNMAVMATTCPVSVVGKDGMGFIPGGYIMAHAIGTPKPWKTQFVLQTLRRGGRPSMAAQQFFSFLKGPIVPVTKSWRSLKKVDIFLAKLIGRVLS